MKDAFPFALRTNFASNEDYSEWRIAILGGSSLKTRFGSFNARKISEMLNLISRILFSKSKDESGIFFFSIVTFMNFNASSIIFITSLWAKLKLFDKENK